MSNRFVVVYEAQADFTTATDLADRVLVAEIDWLDETLLDSQREWTAEDPAGSRLTWKAIPSRARELGIPVRGFFDGRPGLPDAQAARRAIAYVRRCFNAVDAILLIRDMDDQPERRGGLEQARASASSNARIVIGVAIVERESWILSGFDPENDDEQARLNAEIAIVGVQSLSSAAGIDRLQRRRGQEKSQTCPRCVDGWRLGPATKVLDGHVLGSVGSKGTRQRPEGLPWRSQRPTCALDYRA